MSFLMNLSANFLVLFMVLAFVAVVLLVEGLYLYWNATRSPEVRKIEERLHALAAGAGGGGEASILKERLLSGAPALQRMLFAIPRLRRLDRLLEQSGLAWSVSRLLFLSAVAFVVVLGLALLAGLPGLLAFLGGIAGAGVPYLLARRSRTRRLQKLDRQLPESLDLICRALRAGHAFGSGLQMAGEEMPDPIGAEFRIIHEEINYGVSLQQALMNFAARIPSTDVRYFVIAVLIQRESGGNLTEVLGKLAALIRQRFSLLEKVRVLSAEGRLSAWILSLLPFGVAGMIHLINPEFMRVLWTDPTGIKMVGMALFTMLVGVLWMRQIIRIHV